MNKCLSLLLFLSIINLISVAQTINNPGLGDSLFPVAGYSQTISTSGYVLWEDDRHENIAKVVKDSARYFLAGAFTNLPMNNGSALIIDTITNRIVNNQKWRINGLVRTAIPDGQGGFFIGGDFTAIGNITRKYIAQINSVGKPTSWNPACNNTVNIILKRNDTLFIGGTFKQFGGANRSCFAMYSASSNILFASGGGPGFNLMSSIAGLLLQRDTIIYAGNSSNNKNIGKYNFKNNIYHNWVQTTLDYVNIKQLQFNKDSTILIYYGDYNGDIIKAVNNRTGSNSYAINIYAGNSSASGYIKSMKVVNDKCYVAGVFDKMNSIARNGFGVLNATTGAILPDNLNLNGYATFVESQGDKLYIGGRFSSIGSVQRNSFAVLDTSTYTVQPWILSPSDKVTAIAFHNQTAFVAGYFPGINATRKNGLALIDSGSHSIANWSTALTDLSTIKRIVKKGDSLFVLRVTWGTTTCPSEYPSELLIYSTTTGALLGRGAVPATNVNDFLIDSNYMYVSYNHSLKRYNLPNLSLVSGWGKSWQFTTSEHALNDLTISGSKIYAVGDNRYIGACNNIPQRRAYVDIYNKVNGQVLNSYSFVGSDIYYDHVMFDRAVLCDNRLYLHGRFTILNSISRKNFACIDVSSGFVTPWNTDILNSETTTLDYITALQQHKGKIWFGGINDSLTNGRYFNGFGALDTLTGAFTQQFVLSRNNSRSAYTWVDDFILTNSEATLVGSFDSVNSQPFSNFAVFPLTGTSNYSSCPGASALLISDISGSSYQWQMDDGSGFINISDNATFNGANNDSLAISNLLPSMNHYMFRCIVGNNYSDTIKLNLKYIWTGTVNSDWENAGNWLCGSIPDQSADVIINSGPVKVNYNTVIRSLTLNAEQNFSIAPGVIFTITN